MRHHLAATVLAAGLLASTATACTSASHPAPVAEPTAKPTSAAAPRLAQVAVTLASGEKLLLKSEEGNSAASFPVAGPGSAMLRVGYTCLTATPNQMVTVSLLASSGAELFKQSKTCANVTQGFTVRLDDKTGAGSLTVKVDPPQQASYAVAAISGPTPS